MRQQTLLATLTLIVAACGSNSQSDVQTFTDLGIDDTVAVCDDGLDHGYRLSKHMNKDGSLAKAVLTITDFQETRTVAEMTVCRYLDFDPTNPTDGPWTVSQCNNVDWVDRYHVDFIISGFSPDQAVVYHNEAKLVALTCRPL